MTSHNQKTGIRAVNFSKGDFVLRGNVRPGKKLQLTWTGPFRVIDTLSDYIFKIEHLCSKKQEVVHGRRLKHFRNADFQLTEDVKHHLDYQEGELLVIETFEDIRDSHGDIECLVKWRGFEQTENDWLPFNSLREDVPDLLSEFLNEMSETGTKRQREIAKQLI